MKDHLQRTEDVFNELIKAFETAGSETCFHHDEGLGPSEFQAFLSILRGDNVINFVWRDILQCNNPLPSAPAHRRKIDTDISTNTEYQTSSNIIRFPLAKLHKHESSANEFNQFLTKKKNKLLQANFAEITANSNGRFTIDTLLEFFDDRPQKHKHRVEKKETVDLDKNLSHSISSHALLKALHRFIDALDD